MCQSVSLELRPCFKIFSLCLEVCQCVSQEKCHSLKGSILCGMDCVGVTGCSLNFQLKSLENSPVLCVSVCQSGNETMFQFFFFWQVVCQCVSLEKCHSLRGLVSGVDSGILSGVSCDF